MKPQVPIAEKAVTADSKVLLDLADRCEREEPSFYLDKDILRALGFTWRGMAYWSADNKTIWKGPSQFTRSLDAAVTLVPEGAEWAASTLYHLSHAECPLNAEEPQTGRRTDLHIALALCAAALRARAALKGG